MPHNHGHKNNKYQRYAKKVNVEKFCLNGTSEWSLLIPADYFLTAGMNNRMDPEDTHTMNVSMYVLYDSFLVPV